jgi:transcriptional regulator with PAS, ATPase and Fis domain
MQSDTGRSVADHFESAIRDVLGFADVRLCEPWIGPRGGLAGEAVGASVLVPGTADVIRAVTGERPLDPWCAQQLEVLALTAALVLELDRARGRGGSRQRSPQDRVPVLVGSSPEIQAVRDRIDRVAPSVCPVLIQGESGAGKEVVARLIHDNSRRARGPFVAVNCAAIVESLLEAELFGIEDRTATGVRGRRGKFELAAGGTLFLDEIGDLASSAQAKLLRVLQDLTIERVGGRTPIAVDVRIVAATNRDLRGLVGEGRFRADLYYRLNGIEIDVPPLRAHIGDLPALIEHVLRRHGAHDVVRLEPETLAALRHYHWPGNVRELERVIERALVLCSDGVVGVEHLPPIVAEPFKAIFGVAVESDDSLRTFGARYVRLVVERCGNNFSAASRVLGISYHTLRSYLRHENHRASWPGGEHYRSGDRFTERATGVGRVADRDTDPADS